MSGRSAARLRSDRRSKARSEPLRAATGATIASKLRVPAERTGTVSRTALVNRLRATGSFPYLTLVAPAGYGKTTLLSQWARRDDRPFAWVSVDGHDNDATVFLAHVAAAVGAAVEPAAAGLDTLPGLAAALAACPEPLVVVLDDADLLRSKGSLEVVTVIADNLPRRSLVALAGRTAPRLPLARLRSSGRLLELGADELALGAREAGRLLEQAGVGLPSSEVEKLAARTEGWPVGLYLTALSLREAESRGPRRRAGSELFGGEARHIADYLREQCLAQLVPEKLAFLRRTSVLERMSGPLCDVVLGRSGSALELQAIERANLFVVPLDERRGWYRYHHLFRELLRRELDDNEPSLVPELNRRAADWFEAQDQLEAALGAAEAAGDTDRVARLLAASGLRALDRCPVADVERWLAAFDDAELLGRHPEVADVGCWIHALRGRPAATERWLAAAEAGGPSSSRRLLRALLCRDGIEQMHRDAEAALAELAPDSPWRSAAMLLTGCAMRLLGREAEADATLTLAAEQAGAAGETTVRVLADGERALIAAARHDHAAADRLALGAFELAGESPAPTAAAVAALATATRALLRGGRTEEARRCLERTERLAPLLTHAIPWLAVQTRLELARAYVVLRDGAGAGALQPGIDEILGLRPGLGSLVDESRELRRETEEIPAPATGNRAGLTPAELRLLPLLATHLSFREIAEQVFVSRNTVKTQAISVYRKLGVSSRSDAIRRATELGLLAAAAEPRGDFIRAG
jgi:LuxR family maltose regulon positive regulatory protein